MKFTQSLDGEFTWSLDLTRGFIANSPIRSLVLSGVSQWPSVVLRVLRVSG